MPLEALPPELLLHTFSFLSPVQLARAGKVCHDWRQLASDHTLWRQYLPPTPETETPLNRMKYREKYITHFLRLKEDYKLASELWRYLCRSPGRPAALVRTMLTDSNTLMIKQWLRQKNIEENSIIYTSLINNTLEIIDFFSQLRSGTTTLTEKQSFLCSLQVRDANNATPLHYTVLNVDNIALTEHCLRQHSFVDAVDANNHTPLTSLVTAIVEERVVFSAACENMLALLVHYKANINKEREEERWAHNAHYYEKGWTALHVSAKFQHAPLLQVLIKLGAKANAVTENGDTPLHILAMQAPFDAEKTKQMMEKLIAAGGDINAPNRSGYTPLHFALTWRWDGWQPNIEKIRLLLELGADIEAKDKGGSTPLHTWISNCCNHPQLNKRLETVLDILVDAGANLFTQNKWKQMPLETAKQKSEAVFLRLRDYLSQDNPLRLSWR